METGLFFGSFNPVHNGHLQLAEYLLAHTRLEEVWFVVSPCNPLKANQELLDEGLRIELLRLAIGQRTDMLASDIEFDMPRPSYTIDTLRRLSALHPERRFTLIMGGDNMHCFDRWKEHEAILRDYPIMVYPRGSVHETPLYEQMEMVDAPLYPISSTEIRHCIANHEDISQWVMPRVEQFIRDNGLYQ